jgi:putative ABC transport system permease protein
MAPFKLVRRNLTKHPLRSLLTIGSLVVAVFLLCMLRSLVVALEAGVKGAQSNRIWVQSAVSLFVELPLSYQPRIAGLEGVENTCKWQWFGGYFQDPGNFFAQFAVDPEPLLDIYPEIELVEGSREGFLTQRTSCLIGSGLARQFDWQVGDTIPLIGAIFPNPEGTDQPWTFTVAGIYVPRSASIDNRTMFFHWDYFEKSLESGGTTPGTGTIVLRVAPGADQYSVMSQIMEMYENGPQRVLATTEAEFQAQFVSMVGNIPMFVSWIGGGVLIAILLACINTMLMTAREQTHDIGVLKALGFTDVSMFSLLISQSLFMCLAGGVLGVGLALASEPAMAVVLGTMFPGYAITPPTVAFGLVLSLAVGVLAGLVPALTASRLRCVEALRSMV